jgi:type IV pilus assembly protein PilW
MIETKYLQKLNRRSEAGLSLIELLVSLAISLVIALVAAAAYLGTRSTATAISNISGLNETGKLALDAVGRELQMAGYYPAILSTNAANTASLGTFTNTKNTAMTVYNQGLFGCDGGTFDPTTGNCPATTANTPDSIVINYFVIPELDASTLGGGFDCLRQAVSNDPNNDGQRAIGRPLYISNRFALTATNYTAPAAGGAGRTIATRSLACNGNGKASEDTIYEPIFEGVVDMVFRYGVNAGAGSLSPERYYTAAEVTALPTINDKNGWQRVTAVQACILTRTLENSRTQDKTGSLRTYADCRGNVNTYAITDRSLFKRFERVFAIRNNLNGTY